MADARSSVREAARVFLSGWLGESRGAVAQVCARDVRWWWPLFPEELHGPQEVERALRGILADGGTQRLDAMAVADDGTTAVVVLTLACPGQAPTPVTSVLEFSEGLVVRGRTYLDVRAFPRQQAQSS